MERLEDVWYSLSRNVAVGVIVLIFLILDIVLRITSRKMQVYSVDEEVKHIIAEYRDKVDFSSECYSRKGSN